MQILKYICVLFHFDTLSGSAQENNDTVLSTDTHIIQPPILQMIQQGKIPILYSGKYGTKHIPVLFPIAGLDIMPVLYPYQHEQ